MISMLVEEMLRSRGFEVVGPAASTVEALSLIERGGFDYAILDINLGGDERGYDIADRLVRKSIPFAFVTGYGSKAVDDRYSETPVLSKPFCDAELHELVRTLANRCGCTRLTAG